jgi:hypothetical protein
MEIGPVWSPPARGHIFANVNPNAAGVCAADLQPCGRTVALREELPWLPNWLFLSVTLGLQVARGYSFYPMTNSLQARPPPGLTRPDNYPTRLEEGRMS